RRLRPLPRREHLRARAREGLDHRGAAQAQFRHGAAGGLPQGGAADGDGRPLRHPDPLAGRHRRRLSGHRRRGARPGGGDRALDRDLPLARRAQHRGDHRGRRLRRRDRGRDRKPRADAGARLLQRDLAGRRRLDPMARHRQGAGGGDQHEDHRTGPLALRRDRPDRDRAGRRCSPRSGSHHRVGWRGDRECARRAQGARPRCHPPAAARQVFGDRAHDHVTRAPAAGELPPIRVARCDATRRERGLMLFNVRGDSRASEGPAHRGWLLGVDQFGALSCIHRSDRPVQGVRLKPDGHLLVTIVDGLLLEMTLDGRILRQWYATGRYRDRAPPKDAIPVEAETFHHGVNLGPDGSMLLLSMEIREYDNWPGSVTDPGAPHERAKVVGDIVMEVRPDGSKLNEWRLLDLIDPYRVSYGSRANYWAVRGYHGTMDWCHANGTAYDARDDAILVSLRTQDAIIKVDRKSG